MSEHSTQRQQSQAAAVQLNAPARRCSTPGNGSSNRCLIAVIVYLALLLDNMLLTVIVPILPDYLAGLDLEASTPLVLSLEETTPSSKLSHLYRSGEMLGGGHQLHTAKHPIPGKSMVNFTLLQISTERPTTTTTTPTPTPMPTATATATALILDIVQSGGTNATSSTSKVPSDSLIASNVHSNSNRSLTLAQENGSIGLLLAMKALVQLIFNPIVGNATGKFGYRLPIVVGTFFLLVSSLVFTVGESYWALLVARAVQGVGSACINICGMSLVAQNYPEEARRSKVMGIILGSIALGVLLGYPFGGILYDLLGKSAPFIILSTFIFFSLGLQLLTLDLSVQPEVVVAETPKWRPLLECKMILAIVLAIWFSTSTMAMLEPCLPIWLIQYLKPNKWQLGTVFIPDSVGYFVGTNFFGSVAYRFGQVKVSCISLLLVGIASILIPSATTVSQLLLPHFALGLGIGVIDAALVPLLATFVDATLAQEDQGEVTTPISSYGTVYAIQQTSVSLAYCLAPLIGGELAQTFGFAWLMRIVGICNMIYGPVLVYLYHKYDPKILREQHNDMLLQSSGRGSRYKQLYNSMDVE
ncbi:synaptic vesicular amine transporter [Drosophila pseudoobscura]|uniref:Synaptic vesicular amine transporter n=1 Tax=Drosophila pseudoobscura pseudoobscura TaxID=46245 RepID=A0A6I8VCP1_DROPS|nr:synaptic vesicular amine transporter [Drosophila pseudoobscura]XP_015038458.2 synaptic vesicular amine transporter [Drosophila pseudoobscura]XP_033232363.1 synaptic vesicular amine transporter [Drosophila pseudoobscura]